MWMIANAQPVDWILTLVPWVILFLMLWLFMRSSRRSVGFVGGDRRGRVPAVINPTGGVPDVTVVASQPAPAYEAVYHPGSGDHPPFLTVTVFLPTAVDLLASRREEQRQNSLLFRASTHRACSGDKAFDRQFEVASAGAPGVLAAMLKAATVREPLTTLFGLGFTMIRAEGKGLDATWYQYPGGGQVDPKLLESTTESLKRLAESIWQAVPEPEPIIPLSVSMRTTLLAVVPVFVGVGASMLWTQAALLTPPLYLPVLHVAAGLPPMLVLAAILHAMIKRRSHSSRARMMVIIASVISSYFFGDFAFRLLNSQLDRGPAAVHIARVVGWQERDTNNFLQVVPWEASEKVMKVPVSFSTCEQVKAHDPNELGYLRIEVVTQPGLFGYEWLRSYRLLPPGGDGR